MTEVREDVVAELAGSATAEELKAAAKAQKANATAQAQADAGERIGELEAQEAELNGRVENLQSQLKAIRADIRKCNTALGNNTRSSGFGKGNKAASVVAEAMNELGGPVRQRDVIGWIVENERYTGKERALSSSVSQTLTTMCNAGTVVKDDEAKNYTLVG